MGPDVIPENLGTVGYDGIEGLFVKSTEMDSAYQSEGLSLQFYQSYDVSWTKPWKYFDHCTDFNPADLLPCGETGFTNKSHLGETAMSEKITPGSD